MNEVPLFRSYGALVFLVLLGLGCAGTTKAEKNALCVQDPYRWPNVEMSQGTAKKELRLGGQSIQVELCRFEHSAPELRGQTANDVIRSFHLAPDGALLLATEDHSVQRYLVEPGETCRLKLDRSFGVQGILHFPVEDPSISVLETGALLAVGRPFTIRYRDGAYSRARCDGVNMVLGRALAGFGVWLSEISRVDLAKGCERTEWQPEGWLEPEKRTFFFVHPWGTDVVVAGSVNQTHQIAIHDLDGKQKVRFGKSPADPNAKPDEVLCWPRDADACRMGACVLDSNCRKLSAWSMKDGSLLGAVRLDELLGLEDPWPVDLVVGKSNAFLAVSHLEKAKGAHPELESPPYTGLIFRIRGLS